MGRRFNVRLSLALAALLWIPQVAAAQFVPSPWTAADIGGPAIPGSASVDGPTISMSGAGSGLHGDSEQFMFVYQSLTGDGAIIARVDDLDGTSELAEAGVMIRESLAPDSTEATVLFSSQAVAFQRRPPTGLVATHMPESAGGAPVWLKLERRGSMLIALQSRDGLSWTSIGADVIAMSPTVYIGLAVTSSSAHSGATARFSRVSVTPSVEAADALPAGWSSTDVGLPTQHGTATYHAGFFIVSGGGTDISGTADQFQYVYQQVFGDVDITGRVAAVEAADPLTKGGLMLRDSLSASSAHVSVLVTAANGVAFERRPVAGGASLSTTVARGRAPRWVKLQRRGTRVTAYQSVDGARWIPTGKATLAMPAIYVGLSVTSRDASTTATTLFDHVIVGRPNDTPLVVLTAPGAGGTFTAPANVDISAAAWDWDGAVTQVDFFAGTTLVGSSLAAPHAVSWHDVPPGTYPLRAVARDNDGAAGVSVTTWIRVDPSGRSFVVFVPSTNHDTAVGHYVLDIFQEDANPTSATPVVTEPLGKPAVVNSECTVDVTAAIARLPHGSFIATVTAFGPGGSARSGASPSFVH